MVTLLNVKAEDKLSRKLAAQMTQGQWGYENAVDTDGEITVTPVASDIDAQKDKHSLGLVAYFPVDPAGDEDEHDAIAADKMVVFVSAPGVEVEDDKLASNSTTANWAGASFGDKMVVNASGYLTLVGAADAPAGATEVAEFIKYENGIVFYRTL